MLEVKTRLVTPALMALAGIALVGCSASQDGPKYPPPPTTVATANFDLATGRLPYPTDLYFPGTTDGTLNISSALSFHSFLTSVNTLDGWSTSTTLDTSFTLPIDPATISGSTVKIIKLWQDPTTKAPATNPAYLPSGATSPVAGVLTYGTDFTADVSDDIDSDGKILRITPLKPFKYSSGPAYNKAPNAGKILNVGYLVVLTDGLKSTDGQTMAPDTLYAAIKSAPADCSTITDATQKLICQLTKAHLGIAQAVGINPASVILSWSFSTQSADDTLAAVSSIVAASPAAPALIVPTGLTTKNVLASLPGKADIYVGSTQLPYYQTAPTTPTDSASVLTKFWTAAAAPPAPLDPTSRNLTMFNPVPKKTSDVTVPLLVTIPNATSKCAGKPAGGWPVAIVQHGVTGNRSQALAIADAFADACFIVAAIDLPLHGITDTTSPLYCTPAKAQCIGATERTFNLDIQNNTTGAAGSDGKIDPSGGVSGTTFFYLSSPLTSRDNFRQAEADLISFSKSVSGLAIAPGTPVPAGPVGIDAAHVSFVGLSLGAIVGGSHIEFAGNTTSTATLAVPGGTLTKLLRDSVTFGPIVQKLLGASVPPNSYLYNLQLRDVQAILDSADPINHIADAQANVPTHVIKVLNDTVVPNNSTDRLILAGGLHKLTDTTTNNCTPVGKGSGAYTFFKAGSHGSLFDPTASPAATVEMQSQTVRFAASALAGAPCVHLGDASVIDTN